MATTFFDLVNDQLGAPVKDKEDPAAGRQEIKSLEATSLPVALAGIYHQGSSEAGAELILDFLRQHREVIEKNEHTQCLAFTFGTRTDQVVSAMAEHFRAEFQKVFETLNDAACAGYRILLHEMDPDKSKPEDVTAYLVSNRHAILSRLPEWVQLGHKLGDDTIDDVSNKMEGPISNVMHSLGEKFSQSPR